MVGCERWLARRPGWFSCRASCWHSRRARPMAWKPARARPKARTHHLHVIESDHPPARALLTFRDVLRSDPGLCRDYAHLKRDLAHQHSDNRNAYSNAKSDFVKDVLRGAGIQPPSRDRLPE